MAVTVCHNSVRLLVCTTVKRALRDSDEDFVQCRTLTDSGRLVEVEMGANSRDLHDQPQTLASTLASKQSSHNAQAKVQLD